MADLSHWDFAERFSGFDAAALILGIEPDECRLNHEKRARVNVVMERMEWDYKMAVVENEVPTGLPASPAYLRSETLELNQWDSHEAHFDNQKFARQELARWLAAINLPSVYSFDRKPASRGWPWGSYETELLRHLAAAAQEFWTKYEPDKPSTAPKSIVVITWLMERGVAKRAAELVAQILRADGLPTGPRGQ